MRNALTTTTRRETETMYHVENKTLGCNFDVETMGEAQRYRDAHDHEDVTAKLLGSHDGKNDPIVVISAGHTAADRETK